MPRRRTLDETRSLLLDTGAAMLDEVGIDVSLGAITMIDVCRAAGLSTSGSAYKIWPSQDAFRTDLLGHLVSLTDADPETIDQLTEITHAQRDDLPDLGELLRTFTADPEGWAAGGPGYRVFSALLLAARRDPKLAERIHTLDTDIYASLSRLYTMIGDVYGLEWNPPYDAMHLAVTLSALSEGIAARSTIIRDVIDVELVRPNAVDGTDRTWTIYGACVEAIVAAFSRPRTSPSPPATTPPEPRSTALTDDFADEVRTLTTLEEAPVGAAVRSDADATPPTGRRGPVRGRRRSLEETRLLLLETGGKMLLDSGLNVTLGDLDPLDVCNRAGLTSTGSVYKIWDTREAFRTDLIRHYFARRLNTAENPFQVTEALSAAERAALTMTEAIRIIGAAAIRGNGGPLDSVVIAVGLAAQSDPDLAESLRETERASLATSIELYDAGIELFDREWVPPFDARILALALDALVHGFAIRLMSTPELVPDDLMRPTGPDGQLQPWHLFACATEAIIEAFTRPAGSS